MRAHRPFLLALLLPVSIGCQTSDGPGTTQVNSQGSQPGATATSNGGSATNGSEASTDLTGSATADGNAAGGATAASATEASLDSPDAGQPASVSSDSENPANPEPDVTEAVPDEVADAGEAIVESAQDEETQQAEPDAGADPVEETDVPQDYSSDCAGRQARLLDCELLSEGEFACDEPNTEQEVCSIECLLIASCNILETYECSRQASSPLQACFSACAELVEPFLCVEEALEINGSWVCDGNMDCLDGSDEADCAATTFSCESEDQEIPIANECDGVAQCTDGSDEDGCPAFVCVATELEIPERWVCDGAEDCLDASDEAGCAKRLCD